MIGEEKKDRITHPVNDMLLYSDDADRLVDIVSTYTLL